MASLFGATPKFTSAMPTMKMPKFNSTGNKAALMPKLGGASGNKVPSLKFPKLAGMGKAGTIGGNVGGIGSSSGMPKIPGMSSGASSGMPSFPKLGAMKAPGGNSALKGILNQISRKSVMMPRVTRVPMNRMLKPASINASF